jgi:hypothetical protein
MARAMPAIRPEPRHLFLDVPLGLLIGLATLWSVLISGWMGHGRPPWADRGGPYGPYPPPDPDFGGTDRVDLTWPILLGILVFTAGLILRRQRPWIGYALVVVGVAVGLAAGIPGGPDDPDRDLAAVGDEYLADRSGGRGRGGGGGGGAARVVHASASRAD